MLHNEQVRPSSRPLVTLRPMLLALEVAAARVGRCALTPDRPRRRHDAPGQAALDASTPVRSTRLAARLGRGSVLVSATNGKTTTTAMVAEIVGGRLRLQPLGREPPLGGRLHPARRRPVPSSACSRSTRRRCPRSRGGSGRASSPSGTSSATSSTATASSSSSPSAGARRSPTLPDATLVVNADDPLVGELAAGARDSALLRARRPLPRAEPRSSTRPTRPTAATCGDAVRLRRRLRRPPRRLPLPELRPRRRRRSRSPPARSSCTAATAARSRCADAGRLGPRRAARCPASTTSTTRPRPAAIAHALGAPPGEIAAGLGRFVAAFGRFERIARRRQAAR